MARAHQTQKLGILVFGVTGKKKTQNLTLLLQRSNSENGLPDEAPGKLSELTARVRGPIAVQYLSKQP